MVGFRKEGKEKLLTKKEIERERVGIMLLIVWFYMLSIIVINVVNCDSIVSNTTVAATNIESTIGTPAFLIDPTTISSQNTTDAQYEVSASTRWNGQKRKKPPHTHTPHKQ